ncbi:ABC transporter permease [Cellulomonas sp. KH9]|uniref:ABC transporter permease n=1 Tax=Cellulomonas sp. KH9 TaxID=1855324 RepID=UPI0008E1CBCD|nr:ABC transporter permease [Cellulomonas sp. KH9]SFK07154.1 ABC-2 type transport system permease protein [Cellulomonas sp. KH9]
MTAADVRGTLTTGRSPDESMQRVFTRPRWFRGSVRDWVDIWRYRELLGNLVRKELKVKYKDSVLGFFWTLVRPLLQLLVYSVAIGIFLGSGKVIPQFGVYLFTGLLAWSLFTDIIGGSTGSIVGNAGLVKKVYLPRELFPLSVVGASAVNFVLQLVVLIGAYVVTRSWPQAGDLLLVPLALMVLLVFATALGLVLAAANVYLRDVQYLVEVGLLLWFWMTPIVYDWTKVRDNLSGAHEWLFHLYMANPMTNVVLAFQRALWPGGRTEAGAPFYYDGDLVGRLLVVGAVSLVLLWFAQRIFARAQGNFAQEL